MRADTWVEVSASALAHNFAAVARFADVPVCAVVKANGYGHGIVHAARVFVRAGAARLGVTRIEEARALRDAGIDAPILILMPVTDHHEAVKLDCAITVGSTEEIVDLPADARVHLEVDTGMGRFGVAPEEAFPAATAIRRRATLEAVWTHFAAAASPSGRRQLDRFNAVLGALRGNDLEVAAHASNSAALLALRGARFDMVRIGTLLYGQNPPGATAPWSMRETSTWYARVTAVRTIREGETVGYGSEWRAPRDTRVATLPVGYADGLTVEPNARTESLTEAARGAGRLLARALRRRAASPRAVWFGERRAPVVGRVAMQSITVSLDGIPDVKIGSVARIPARRLMIAGEIERIDVE